MLPHQATVDRLPEELEFFDPPIVQSTIEGSFAMDIFPVGQIINTEVLENRLPRSKFYLDLSEVFLYLKLNIVSNEASYVVGKIPGEVTLNRTRAVQQAAQGVLKVNKLSEELATASAEANRPAAVLGLPLPNKVNSTAQTDVKIRPDNTSQTTNDLAQPINSLVQAAKFLMTNIKMPYL